MVHGEKFFTIKENQEIWDKYLNNIMDTWDAENKEKLEQQTFTDEEKSKYIKKLSGYSEKGKDSLTPYKFEYRKKKMSVQQYKPIVLEFEEFVGKSFNQISAKEIEDFLKSTQKNNRINHFNAFIRDCVNTGLITNRNKDFLIMLLPEGYRSIGKMLIEGEDRKTDNVSLQKPKGLIRCPFCGREKEAVDQNWLLIQIAGETEKHIACKECEGGDGKYKY